MIAKTLSIFVSGKDEAEAIAAAEQRTAELTLRPEYMWTPVPGTFAIRNRKVTTIGRTTDNGYGEAFLRAETSTSWEVGFAIAAKIIESEARVLDGNR